MIVVNGKEMSKEDALGWINNPSTIITHFSMEMDNKTKDGSLTHEGFGIDKDYIATFSKQMDEFNAGYMRAAFKNSSKIGGKDLYLVFIAPNYLSRWQKLLLGLIERLL